MQLKGKKQWYLSCAFVQILKIVWVYFILESLTGSVALTLCNLTLFCGSLDSLKLFYSHCRFSCKEPLDWTDPLIWTSFSSSNIWNTPFTRILFYSHIIYFLVTFFSFYPAWIYTGRVWSIWTGSFISRTLTLRNDSNWEGTGIRLNGNNGL